MSTVSEMLRPYPIPPVAKTRQFFCDTVLEQPEEELLRQLEASCAPIQAGQRIAITCGSRGIDNLVSIVRSVAAFCKAQGAEPFVIPAMGSHGGATAEGQIEVLRGYGITEESTGAPIVSSMGILGFGQ